MKTRRRGGGGAQGAGRLIVGGIGAGVKRNDEDVNVLHRKRFPFVKATNLGYRATLLMFIVFVRAPNRA